MPRPPVRPCLAACLLALLAAGAWAQPVFGDALLVTDAAEGARKVFAADLDGDGDLDLLVAASASATIAWHANLDGAGSFGPAQPIDTSASNGQAAWAADLDGDGDQDVLATITAIDTIAWYENTDGAGSFGPRQVISTLPDDPHAVIAADVDGDGDVDALSSSQFDDRIAWYENLAGDASAWADHTISVKANKASSVQVGDLDGDGDLDVISTSLDDDELAWYENLDGHGSFGPQLVVSTAHDKPHASDAADLDGDGDLDLLCVSEGDDELAWFENLDGAGGFGPQQIIDAGVDGAWSVKAADLDGDGDLDAAAASSNDDTVAWIENTTPPLVEPGFSDLGFALPGALGPPKLVGVGLPLGGETIALQLGRALPGAPAWIVLGFEPLQAPFKLGVLVPAPFKLLGPLGVGPTGGLLLPVVVPEGLPPGIPALVQFWIEDPSGPVGFTASNGLEIVPG